MKIPSIIAFSLLPWNTHKKGKKITNYWITNQKKGLREVRGKNMQVAEHKDPVRSPPRGMGRAGQSDSAQPGEGRRRGAGAGAGDGGAASCG